MDRREFFRRSGLAPEMLDIWVDAGWLAPADTRGAWTFTEIDLARTRLIQDLTVNFGVNDEGVPIILGLVDQLFGLRRALRDVLSALRAQPVDERAHVAAELRAARSQRDDDAAL